MEIEKLICLIGFFIIIGLLLIKRNKSNYENFCVDNSCRKKAYEVCMFVRKPRL